MLDIYIVPHVNILYTQIRNRTLIHYFSPYLVLFLLAELSSQYETDCANRPSTPSKASANGDASTSDRVSSPGRTVSGASGAFVLVNRRVHTS